MICAGIRRLYTEYAKMYFIALAWLVVCVLCVWYLVSQRIHEKANQQTAVTAESAAISVGGDVK